MAVRHTKPYTTAACSHQQADRAKLIAKQDAARLLWDKQNGQLAGREDKMRKALSSQKEASERRLDRRSSSGFEGGGTGDGGTGAARFRVCSILGAYFHCFLWDDLDEVFWGVFFFTSYERSIFLLTSVGFRGL
jgi:hypothetical protein